LRIGDRGLLQGSPKQSVGDRVVACCLLCETILTILWLATKKNAHLLNAFALTSEPARNGFKHPNFEGLEMLSWAGTRATDLS
jgi:hypothetical protein